MFKAFVGPQRLTTNYADYAVWQRVEQLPSMSAALAYWQTQLAELNDVDMYLDSTRPPHMTRNGANLHFTIPANIVSALQDLTLAHGTTLFTGLLAVFALLLRERSGQYDVTIGECWGGNVK
jgi:hypothetical protein